MSHFNHILAGVLSQSSGKVFPTDGLLAYFKFEEKAATTLVNDSFGPYNAYANVFTQTISDISGKNNRGFFPTGTQRITLPSDIALISFSGWINFKLVSSTGYFLGSTTQGVRYNGTDFLIYNGTAGFTVVPWMIQDKLVHFVCNKINAREYDIYIDGEKIGTSTHGGSDNIIYIRYLFSRAASFYFAGLTDEFAFWNRALTVTEIATIYNNGQGVFL